MRTRSRSPKPAFLALLCSTLCLLWFGGNALASPLSQRNLPEGQLLYTDGTNAYYGVYLTDQFEAAPNPQARNVEFRVIAFRKPAADGTLIKFVPRTFKSYAGKPMDGVGYDEDEIDLINKHIMQAVDERFPQRRNKNYLRLLIYEKDAFYAGSPVSASNPDLEAPEKWVTVLNFERAGPGAPMRPAYEARGNTGLPKGRFATSAKGRKPLPPGIAAQRSARQRSVATTEPATNSTPPQQVVKPQEFWDRLQFTGTVKAVFEGDFSNTASKTFKMYFSALQWAYSDRCKSDLPANAVKRGYITQRVYDDGFRDDPVERSALIAPEFVVFYDAYQDDVSSAMQQYRRSVQNQANTSISRGGNWLAILGNAANNHPMQQLDRFVVASGGCASATLYQLRQNFLRAARGAPSLQDAGIVLKKAAQESAAATPSLYGACLDRHPKDKSYCLCFENEALGVLSASEKKRFEADFDQYYQAMRKIDDRPRPPASDRAWVLNSIRAKCN
ncbi:hypothetical protein ATO7_14043 [Oceanococcus atlanticus]|uniref:Uncharacterized protein n=1 Tax=Oceanococcus atlanticus TaxID=1317117 RepID=A0A1Y1SE13_9GAMM|nr:hypothetical protein ATO7_14043 [Oceanococcus atlanticus]